MRKMGDEGCDGPGLQPDSIRGLTVFALEEMSRALYEARDMCDFKKTYQEFMNETPDVIHQQYVEEQSRWN